MNYTIGVIGSGAMGSGIAQVAAVAGHQVIIYDNNASALEKSRGNLATTLQKLEEYSYYRHDVGSKMERRLELV